MAFATCRLAALDPGQALLIRALQRKAFVGPVDLLWHLLNFFAPAAGMGLIAPTLAKLLWRRGFAGVRWARLAAWVTAASAAALLLGLIAFGRDGKMATYGAMVLACALTLWWFGFGVRQRGSGAR